MSNENTDDIIKKLFNNAQAQPVPMDELSQLIVDTTRKFLVDKGFDHKVANLEEIVAGLMFGELTIINALGKAVVQQHDLHELENTMPQYVDMIARYYTINIDAIAAHLHQLYVMKMAGKL